MNQPDLHHDGPITPELVKDLEAKIKSAIAEVCNFVPPDSDPEWVECQKNWHNSLTYAGLRLVAIGVKLEHNIEYRVEEDHKCIDIMLCILRDYDAAKAKGFER